MSERWKYQIKYGLIWALITLLVFTIFDYNNNTWIKFFQRLLLFPIAGIFIMGYIGWRRKNKQKSEL